MSSVLHAITALPGEGRYAVTFRHPDGTEQTAVVHLAESRLDVAEASLPAGMGLDSPAFVAIAAAVAAVDDARRHAPAAAALRDIDGGWDVSLGNVVLDDAGSPMCTAHGAMTATGAVWTCGDCGAQALFD